MRILALFLVSLALSGCVTTSSQKPPLFRALEKGDLASVDRITREDPSAVNSFDRIYSPIAHTLYEFGWVPGRELPPRFSVDAIRILLDRGADPKVATYYQNPLMIQSAMEENPIKIQSAMEVAARVGNIEVMALLLSRGEKPNQDDALLEAVHEAAFAYSSSDREEQQKSLDVVSWMLSNGWSVNEQPKGDIFVGTPIHIAVSTDNIPLIELLLFHGANVNLLLDREFGFYTTPMGAAAYSNPSPQAFKLLIEHGADVNLNVKEGRTLLHIAARSNESPAIAQIIQLLLDAGIDPNTLDSETSDSPLGEAAFAGNAQAARVLIAAGADVNYRNSMGKTPLDISAESMKPGDEHHYEFHAALAQAGGQFVMNTPPPRPAPRPVQRIAEEKPKDNFAAALLGGLAASAIGYSQGMSEAAAVDFAVSMAQDIQNETVTIQSFEATRFQAANEGRATAQVYEQHLSNSSSNIVNTTTAPVPTGDTLNNRINALATKQAQATQQQQSNASQTSPSSITSQNQYQETRTTPKQNTQTQPPTKMYDVVPTAVTTTTDTWWNTREKAIEYAQLKGANQVTSICYSNKARADRDDKSRWTYGQPNCQQGGFAGNEWKCEVRTSYPCYRMK